MQVFLVVLCCVQAGIIIIQSWLMRTMEKDLDMAGGIIRDSNQSLREYHNAEDILREVAFKPRQARGEYFN